MSTFDANLRSRPTFKVATGKVLAASGAILAIGVAALFLVLMGAGASHRSQSPAATHYPPMIQYHGTGAPPVFRSNRVAVTSGSSDGVSGSGIPGDIRTEHSYGAVP
jgi:hypothetical protein